MNRWNAALAIGLAASGSVVVSNIAQAQGASFPDIPQNHWAYQDVQTLADKGLVKGYPNGEFLGKGSMSRYEFASIIARLLETVSDMTKAQAVAPATAPQITQADLDKIQVLVDKFQGQLDTIQTNVTAAQSSIDDLRQDVLDTQATASKALDTAKGAYSSNPKSKFNIGGYVQARFTSADTDNQTRFPHGKPSANSAFNGNYMQGANARTFNIRRARIKFFGQLTDNTHYAIQLDTSGIANPAIATSTSTGSGNISTAAEAVTIREANIGYTFGDGTATYPTITVGMFANPFGYELPSSGAAILTPEKPLAVNEGGNGLFANLDYDRGMQLQLARGSMKYTYALTNGTGQVSNATSGIYDQTYRAAYAAKNGIFGAGVSYVNGELANTSYLQTIPNIHKSLFGADAQYVSPKGPFLLAEYVGGKYETISGFSSATALGASPVVSVPGGTAGYNPGNHAEGYYVQGGYTAHATGNHPFTIGVSCDVLKRNEGLAIPLTAAQAAAGFTNGNYEDENLGYGILYNMDKATRLRIWYVKPSKVAHGPLAAGTSIPKIGLLTTELQVKF